MCYASVAWGYSCRRVMWCSEFWGSLINTGDRLNRIYGSADTSSTTIVLRDDLDVSNILDIEKHFNDLVAQGVRTVTLDFSSVSYLGSTGIKLILRMYRFIAHAGGTLIIDSANETVLGILSLVGMFEGVPGAEKNLKKRHCRIVRFGEVPLKTWSFKVPDDLDQMWRIRERLIGYITPLGFDETTLFNIKTAFGEALTNALVHGRSTCGRAEVVVAVVIYTNGLVIEVRDKGCRFDERLVSEVVPEFATCGRGLKMMRLLIDYVDVDYCVDGGMLVRLVKYLDR